MKVHGRIFQPWGAKDIMEGRKTQTRRIISPQPEAVAIPEEGFIHCDEGGHHVGRQRMPPDGDVDVWEFPVASTIKPGDLIWVRETCGIYQTVNRVHKPDGRSFSEVSDGLVLYKADGHSTIQDAADHIRLMSGQDFESITFKRDRWVPSIHMPRWASRLTLHVDQIMPQRLQDILSGDVYQEGVGEVECSIDIARELFCQVWESIHGDGSWHDNPWVWAIYFTTHAMNVDEYLKDAGGS